MAALESSSPSLRNQPAPKPAPTSSRPATAKAAHLGTMIWLDRGAAAGDPATGDPATGTGVVSATGAVAAPSVGLTCGAVASVVASDVGDACAPGAVSPVGASVDISSGLGVVSGGVGSAGVSPDGVSESGMQVPPGVSSQHGRAEPITVRGR